ncbi:DUF1761 domain-containing protein [Flavobacterium rhizosphaerae]|uniref:DUF1761 domain-containing protein n=1 Tax=Flavobacterium rhizosphaerae TaxID=3163298 RepID=A0ABW8YZU8_9FLAO
MLVNPWAFVVATIIMLPIGFIWYNPKVFGTIWMREAGIIPDPAQKGNMLKIFALTLLFAFMANMLLQTIVVHQMGAMSLIGGAMKADSAKPSYTAFMADYADAYRTFKHGALHGCLTGIFLGLPIAGTSALFEKKSWKYILINSGYWVVCLTLMGGILCSWQ